MNRLCDQHHLLLDYAADRLTPERRAEVETHLEVCPDCRTGLAETRQLSADLARLQQDGATDMSEPRAKALLAEARAMLNARRDAVTFRLSNIRQKARRRNRWALVRRMLIPAAVAAAVFVAITVVGRHVDRQGEPVAAIRYLYADAGKILTVEDIVDLEPVARRALDEAMAEVHPDISQVANLQLVHYITLQARDPGQIDDIHFLLSLLQANERRNSTAAADRDIWDLLAGLENRALAADGINWLDNVRRLLRADRYEDAYQYLVRRDLTRVHPLTVYAAVRAGRPAEAQQLLEAMVEMEHSDPRLIQLLWAELSLEQERYDLAIRHYITAAESDSRFWFQAAYLSKYELNDDVLAGELFERTGDLRVIAHITRRFKPDVRRARMANDNELLAEDFDDFPVGSVPGNWKLTPTHAGEYSIARVDESNILKLNELGYTGAKLYTGYPGWNNYTLSCDFKFLRRNKGADLQLAVYERGVNRYGLNLSGNVAQLIHKRYNDTAGPADARTQLPKRVDAGQWWRVVVRVDNLSDRQTRISATVWQRGAPQPEAPQIVWTETSALGERPLQQGMVALRLTEAEVAFDNVHINANDDVP
jgi:tetratricopeptide (TPR) repeat protein